MTRGTPLQHDSSLDAMGDIWAILTLIFMSLFIAILSLLAPQGPPDFSDDLAQESAQLTGALSRAAASIEDTQSQLSQAQSNLDAKELQLTEANSQIDTQRDRADAAEDEVTRAETQVANAERAAESANQRAEEAEGKLATRALEVVIAVDDSGSMEDEHRRLAADQKLLAEALAPLAPLSIGSVAYLEGRRTFNLTPIVPRDSDNGRSLNALNRFIDSYESRGGRVDLIAAVQTSINMLNRSQNPSAKRTLVILSDVSVYETRDENEATQLIRELSGWVQSSPRNAVLVIYTGDEVRDRTFYRRLAAAGGPRVTVSENPSDMLPQLLRAMTTR